MKKTLIPTPALFALAASILSFPLLAGGEDYGHHGSDYRTQHHARHGGGAGHLEMLAALELTDEQKEAIHEVLMQAHEGSLKELDEAARSARTALDETIHDFSASERDVRKAAQEYGRRAADLAVEQHRLTTTVEQMLSPQQREKLRELIANRELRVRHDSAR
jgi:Spy/CpxP family protein refolding chaperone